MYKIHLDTDLGGDIDDLCALAMLLRWSGKVELNGITTVAEANGRRAGYARYVLGLEGRNDIPVAAGADVAQGFYRYAELSYPAEERYWPEPIEPSPNPLDDSIHLLKQSIEQGVTIIAIGPYTNLYLLDLQYPGILMQAKLFLMGGYIYRTRAGFPSWGNEMDWNIQVDLKSAKHGEAFATDEQNEIRFGETCEGLPHDIINFQHDPLTCAIALGWNEGIEMEELPLLLEEKDGWLTDRIDPSGKTVPVVTQVDGPRFNEFWINVL